MAVHNNSFQRIVKKLRFFPLAEFRRYALRNEH